MRIRTHDPNAVAREKVLRAEEFAFRDRELKVKEGELSLHRDELALKVEEHSISRWRSPLVVAILAAALSGAANLWGT